MRWRLLVKRELSHAFAPGPLTMNWPMCEMSNTPAAVRTARCSARMPLGYCTGMDQPPKPTILPPSRTCAAWSGVCLSAGEAGCSAVAGGRESGRMAASVDTLSLHRRGGRACQRRKCKNRQPAAGRFKIRQSGATRHSVRDHGSPERSCDVLDNLAILTSWPLVPPAKRLRVRWLSIMRWINVPGTPLRPSGHPRPDAHRGDVQRAGLPA